MDTLTAERLASPSRVIHDEDYIFRFLRDHPSIGAAAAQHYLDNGASSAQNLRSVLSEDTTVEPDNPFTMLEFASGFGCVTRHLPYVLPAASSVACDIHEKAISFLRTELKADAVLSKSNPAELDIGSQFDVVFALSFFSHMPDKTWGAWLATLYRHVAPGGSLIFTTHGSISLAKLYRGEFAIDQRGYGFVGSSEQGDLDTAEYGTTMTTPDYVTRLIYRNLDGARLAVLREGFWWQHQDAYVVAKPH